MGRHYIELICGLACILVCCELFTNGIERYGKIQKLGYGVIGGIFSAVGTCLPETFIPIISIFFAKNGVKNFDIGIGAIIGAPFMLSTLAFFITGISVLVFAKKRKTGYKMFVNQKILKKDITFFIIVYSIGISACFINRKEFKYAIALLLVIAYLKYILITIKMDKKNTGKISPLYFNKFLNLPTNIQTTIFQIAFSLIGIIIGAKIFINNIEIISWNYNISPLILSLLVTPIATELPEKFNSIIWISRKKDNLALGNLTGAMVFQSCIPVSIGILATDWKVNAEIITSAVFSLMSAMVLLIYIIIRKKLTPFPLLAGGIFYIMFIYLIYINII